MKMKNFEKYEEKKKTSEGKTSEYVEKFQMQ